AFAKELLGVDVNGMCYDIKGGVGDKKAKQVSLAEFQEKVDVVSLHTPETPLTINLINTRFIQTFKKSFWLINTARGKSVVTEDLVNALKSGKILGAGLDVLEYEKASFEDRSEEHTSELQSREKLVCRLLLEKKKCGRSVTPSPGRRQME